ncbi:bifunctional riboflavin kinase/FAD synthetase [Acholeplasma granularum]|uniref:bifunctional riboflavin kinase/FAD synthetase n=1 Tax=Acholeplasma granularum TaxID=264635 RepID=UPI00046E712D|nr:bifunctional riboflavin kinase/FAD synthetase [Acholeplasma granularum]
MVNNENMQTQQNTYENIKNDEPLTLTIGNFDGLHLGHQNLIKKTKMYNDSKSAVMTFDPHPMQVITKRDLPVLMNFDEKQKELEKLGINNFFVVNFNSDFSKLSPQMFIDFLKRLNVIRIVVGRDFKFGYKGQGNVDDLKLHFDTVVVDDLLHNNTRISTSYIKLLLESGDIKLAKKLLNKSYEVSGKVVHGDKVGKLIGYPTANIDYKNHFLPKVGIYAVYVKIDGKTYLGCANLGHNPTLNYSTQRRLEVFIIDYDGNLYDKELSISFEHYLRDEVKYEKLEDMLKQIAKDVKQSVDLLK